MPEIHIIDLQFQFKNLAIAAFLMETGDGLLLIETGPESTYTNLERGVEQAGFSVNDIRHVLLTHIHFDHAGAAWKLAQKGADIYVHPTGLPHLHQPDKLWNSAAQIYGDKMETLWGRMKSIPLAQLKAVDDGDRLQLGELPIDVLYTPGHAVHHNAYQIGTTIFTGDLAGVKVGDGPVVPPCPPPDINIELWKQSLAKVRKRKPEALYLTHFGCHQNVSRHLDAIETVLDDWADYIKPHFEKGTAADELMLQFTAYTQEQLRKKGLSEAEIGIYEYANPSWMSVTGLLRYWKLKSQGRI